MGFKNSEIVGVKVTFHNEDRWLKGRDLEIRATVEYSYCILLKDYRDIFIWIYIYRQIIHIKTKNVY